MNHRDILKAAASLLTERGKEYGPEDACFDRSAKLASIALNKSISMYDVSIILAMNKIARLQESRTKTDHYIDMINYAAFAAQFSEKLDSVATAAEDDVRALARRLAGDPTGP